MNNQFLISLILFFCFPIAFFTSAIAQHEAEVPYIMATPRTIVAVQPDSSPALFQALAKRRPGMVLNGGLPNAALTSDGRHAIVCELNQQISIVNTDDLTSSTVLTDPRCISAWADTQRNGFFVVMLDEVLDLSRANSKDTEVNVATWYFESIDGLRAWDPRWKLPGFACESSYQWIDSAKIWVSYSRPSSKKNRDAIVHLIDDSANILGRFELQGEIFGMEMNHKNELEIYYAVPKKGNMEWSIKLGLVHPDKQKLDSNRELYRVQTPYLVKSFTFGSLFNSRRFRFRGLKDGDIRNYARDIFSQPTYFTHRDSALMFAAEQNEYRSLQTQFENWGSVSCRENSEDFEFVDWNAHLAMLNQQHDLPLLVNRNGNGIVFELMRFERIVDIVVLGSRGIALSNIHPNAQVDGAKDTFRIWDFEIPISASQAAD